MFVPAEILEEFTGLKRPSAQKHFLDSRGIKSTSAQTELWLYARRNSTHTPEQAVEGRQASTHS